MKQVIAMGGGGFTDPQSNLKIEKYLLSQIAKDTPKICFLPQASNEAQGYVVKFYETFLKLGAEPTWISLFGRVEDGWKQKIIDADIIYVGGGNTKSMLALWKTWGVDKLLKHAYDNGTVMSGISAGAICWFEQGITDSVWPLGALDCLGFVSGSCCPHYDSEKERPPVYREKVNAGDVKPGVALQDKTAAHFIDGELKTVISCEENKSAFYVDVNNEKLIQPELLT